MRQALLAVVLAAVLAVPAPAALSPAAYHRQGTVLCTWVKSQGDKISKQLDHGAWTRQKLIRAYKGLIALGAQFLARFRALDPPGALRATHERAAASLAQAFATTRQLVVLLQDGKPVKTVLSGPVVERLDRFGNRADAAFRRLGLPGCAG